ncbi:MAG: glycosyltransferase family 4 protein [Terrimicrobiaceae bacterium]
MTESGGIENHLVRFCEHMHAAGVPTVFFCPDYRAGRGLDSRLRKVCERMFVFGSARGKETAWKRVAWLFWRTLLWPRNLRGVLYLNGQGGAPAWVAKGLRGAASRVVLHHHSSGDAEDIASCPGSYLGLMTSADSVVACSESNARLLEAESRRKVEVVYCFSEPCCGIEPPAPSETLNFGFFGRLIPEKGIDTILRLAVEPSLSDIRWHLWGPLEGYSEGFTDSTPTVDFHGSFHGRAGLLGAMSKLDAFVLFSTHNEGLPLVLLEAMSAGLPWIASDRGGIRDLVSDPSTTLLLPRDFSHAEALTAVRSLADSIKSGVTKPDALRYSYNEKFHPEKLVGDWLRVFGLGAKVTRGTGEKP